MRGIFWDLKTRREGSPYRRKCRKGPRRSTTLTGKGEWKDGIMLVYPWNAISRVCVAIPKIPAVTLPVY